MANVLRTILVDDEQRGLNSLQKLLQMNCPEVVTMAQCNSADAAIGQIKLLEPDLVFLDIAMPGKNGFEMLKELGNIHFEVIFVTAHNQFMIDAFRFSAVDYLLKPIADELLVEAVARAQKRVMDKSTGIHLQTLMHNLNKRHSFQSLKLCIPSLKGFSVVEIDQILYAEASGNYTSFYFTDQAPVCTSKPIHEYEDLLADSGFVRVHKSHLVNLLHIKEYLKGEGGSIVISNGTVIDVSRRKRDVFIARMKSYYKY